MSKRNNLYLGKSGQFAIMAEFLARGWKIINRDTLNDLYESSNIGSVSKDKNLMIHISFEDNSVKCSDVDFSSFIDNFSEFPHIEH